MTTVPGRLADRVEVNAKALPARDALASLVAEDRNVCRLPDAARRRPDYEASLRLGEAVAAALESRAVAVGRKVLRELAPRARAVAAGLEVRRSAPGRGTLTGAARLSAARRPGKPVGAGTEGMREAAGAGTDSPSGHGTSTLT
ncbi:GvpL/GvpF family gas vesicle protein [Streptomyces sp. NPDC005281]|uniref:GvpL/GvpF family gas vesicle protein n=1 Tax=Streptomyces sp. NPDC005281 TaxID=3155712 RepID=UPI0033BE0B89